MKHEKRKKLSSIRYLLSTVLTITIFFSFAGKINAKDLEFEDPTNYVNDYANVISDSVEAEVNAQLKQFEEETTTQIFVVSTNDFRDTYMEDYAVKLFEEWGIGQEKEDNGLLLLFQPEGEAGSRVRIEVGYGLEGAIPDAMAGRILDNDFMPYYFNKDYDTAVKETINSLQEAAEGEYTAETTNDFTNEDWFGFGIFFLFIVASILGSTKSWWLGGVVGFLAGIIIGFTKLGLLGGVLLPIPFAFLGFFIDFILSKSGMFKSTGRRRGFWASGFSSGGGFSGGGFSGGGGGSSGGGGASR